MWKLSLPDIGGAVDDLTAAFTYIIDKDPIYVLSDQEKEEIIELYEKYDVLKGSPNEELKGIGLGEALLKAIKGAYGQVQDNGRLSDLRSRLKMNGEQCPFCGYGPIQELDHHLPKVVFRPFAIYPRNLVPICGSCNKKKSAAASGELAKQFIHAYFEEFPDEEFFVADTAIDRDSEALIFKFRIQRSSGMSELLANRLTNQIDKLELNSRYARQVITFLLSQKHSMEVAYGGDCSAMRVKQFIAGAVDSHQRNFGKNDFRTVILRSLKECEEFCNGGFIAALGSRSVGA